LAARASSEVRANKRQFGAEYFALYASLAPLSAASYITPPLTMENGDSFARSKQGAGTQSGPPEWTTVWFPDIHLNLSQFGGINPEWTK